MALTAHDIKQIRLSVSDVVEPRFVETNQRLEKTHFQIDQRFGELKNDFELMSSATNRKFQAVFTDVAVMRDDLFAVRQLVSEHGFRISRLEHETGEAGE